MRRLSQELEEAVVWPDSNENVLPLSRSRSFSLRLTRLFGNQLITDDLPANQIISGMHLHRLFHLFSSIIDDDDLTDPKIIELCEIFFGYTIFPACHPESFLLFAIVLRRPYPTLISPWRLPPLLLFKPFYKLHQILNSHYFLISFSVRGSLSFPQASSTSHGPL